MLKMRVNVWEPRLAQVSKLRAAWSETVTRLTS